MFLTPKLSYRSYRFFSSLRRWTRRRFTQTGLALLGGAGISGVMSADTEQTLGYQIFPLVGCLLLTSLAWGWGFRGRFGVRRLLPRFATAGQALRYRVVVGNQGRRPQKGLTVLEDLADSRPSCAEFIADRRAERARMSSFSMAWLWNRRRSWMATVKAVPVPDLPPGQEAEVELELVPSRRGILRFEGVTVARTDPLGLVRAFTRWPAAQSLLVLPRRYPLPPIALPGGRRYQQGGVAMASSVGDSEEFVSLREYRRGDPLRHIHWRSWAKVDKPIVKEFQDEFFVRHALILDTYLDHPTSPSFEGAIDQTHISSSSPTPHLPRPGAYALRRSPNRCRNGSSGHTREPRQPQAVNMPPIRPVLR